MTIVITEFSHGRDVIRCEETYAWDIQVVVLPQYTLDK
eukprot:CAMPEP_0114032204 /NCGR_PEP_ID=MMETSP1159-20121227/5209_1 /TAXON_ID=88271 /ORGANISM="Picocystis salinarum" /LENGTH=37 /assembly_acc=CAM_ASM_000767